MMTEESRRHILITDPQGKVTNIVYFNASYIYAHLNERSRSPRFGNYHSFYASTNEDGSLFWFVFCFGIAYFIMMPRSD